MRLNPFNTGGINVGTTGGGVGRAGGLGCGTIIVAAIGYFVFGLDPMSTVGAIQGAGGSGPVASAPQNEDEQAICTSNAYATETCNALASLNQTWEPIFAQAGARFQQPTLRFAASERFNTACGPASTGMGPFYCPADQTIYIDTGFYDQLAQMSGNGGDFARYYVIAHEYGHHVQTITGVSEQIRSAQSANPRQANQLQVLMELHADCYAGVWAGRNRSAIEPGDIEEGMMAAAAIGDDTLQRRAGRGIDPEGFTHGTSEQRMQALRLGMQGDDTQCDQILQAA